MASGLPTAFRHIKDNQKPLRFNSNGRYYKVPDDVFSSRRLNEAPYPTNERRDEFES